MSQQNKNRGLILFASFLQWVVKFFLVVFAKRSATAVANHVVKKEDKMFTSQFETALAKTVKIEGGFVNHPADRGGPTNLGVTIGTLNRWYGAAKEATVEDVMALDHPTAKLIYHDLYWGDNNLPCQNIAEWSEPLSWECFDSAVLHGPARAAYFLQDALNLLNRNEDERLFKDLKVDGWAGTDTLKAMRKLDNRAYGKRALLVAVNVEQASFLRNLARRDPTQEAFYVGWILHRIQFEGKVA